VEKRHEIQAEWRGPGLKKSMRAVAFFSNLRSSLLIPKAGFAIWGVLTYRRDDKL
jgi:hypothetical protein